MYLADALSGAYLNDTDSEASEWQSEFCLHVEQINVIEGVAIESPLLEEIRQSTSQDQELRCVSELIRSGWPSRQQDAPMLARPHQQYHHEISQQDGLLFEGDRVIIPMSLRSSMVGRIHSAHLGVEGCLRRAREAIFWPGMNAEVKHFVERCSVCTAYRPAQCREPLQPHGIPARPWQKIAIDLFELGTTNYVILVDYYSSFFEVDKLSDTASTTIVHKTKGHFARHGIPDVVITDNGPQFSCREFSRFARDWHFKHTTTSPRYPQANGKVENTVKTCKNLLQKAMDSKQDVYLALLDFRNTPSEIIGSSPAQRLFGRRTRTQIPMSSKLLEPETIDGTEVTANMQKAKEKQAKRYDNKSKSLPPLIPGEQIRMKRPGDDQWSLAYASSQ